jgi:MoxR-like ATPase
VQGAHRNNYRRGKTVLENATEITATPTREDAIADLATVLQEVATNGSTRKFARSTGAIKWEPVRDSVSRVCQTEYAKDLSKKILFAHPEPVLLEGDAGGGKSVIMRIVAHKAVGCDNGFNALQCPNHLTCNGFLSMEMRDLTADMVPVPAPGGGVSLEAVLGLISRMVEAGGSFGFEEMNRAPNEIHSRLFHLMDFQFRGWDLPEIRRHDFPVHQSFWLWATCNPVGGPYATNRLDKAVQGRFIQTHRLKVEDLLCDEEAVLDGILGGDTELVQRIMHFVSDLRNNEATRIDTRRVCMLATLIKRGMDVMDAVSSCVATSLDSEQETAVITAGAAHFTNR